VDKEKRLSRPNSGSFTMPRFSTLRLSPSKNGSSSNRDSVGKLNFYRYLSTF